MAMTEVVDVSPAATRVDWAAVFAGATITTGVALVLLSFGAALGLGVSSPNPGEGVSPAAFAIAAGLFLLWVQVMSFFMGGYVTARLRPRDVGTSEHETDVRDGLHGLITWGVGVIAAGVITLAGVGGIGVAAHSQPPAIASSIAQVTNQHVDQGASADQSSDAQAADATQTQRRADVLRKLSIISSFITAASLLAGAVAAFFGAHSGGHHRDKNLNWAFFNSTAR